MLKTANPIGNIIRDTWTKKGPERENCNIIWETFKKDLDGKRINYQKFYVTDMMNTEKLTSNNLERQYKYVPK